VQAPPPAPSASGTALGAADLDAVNATLAVKPYVAGFSPSAADVRLPQLLNAAGETAALEAIKTRPNLKRWLSHARSFNKAEMASWK
jgi:glutathione S-transferase